jgi:hypothetical protein
MWSQKILHLVLQEKSMAAPTLMTLSLNTLMMNKANLASWVQS